MPRTYSKVKKRGKASVAKRLRDKREKSYKNCTSNEYVEEDSHIDYYNCSSNDDLPPLEIECDRTVNSPKIQGGNRIVDISFFIQECQKLAAHDFKCTMGKMVFKKEVRRGIVSCFHYYCFTCEKDLKIYTHSENVRIKTNKMLVWGANSVGIGYAQTKELLNILNLPMMSSKYYRKIETIVGEEWELVLQKEMTSAGEEERRQAIEAGNLEEGIPFITVIIDRGWAKRSYGHGFSSLSGVAVIIGKKTGKLLFVGVRNKYCSICSSKNEEDIKPHKCYKNFNGASTAMEQDVIVEGFNRSVNEHGVRYKYVIGDGDSSVYARIIQLVTYGRYVIKLECANHITRCYTSNLYKISLKTSHDIETRRILKTHIPRLSIAVRSAISNNSKEGVGFATTTTRLKNGPYHVFGDHKNCRVQYCKRQDKQEMNHVSLLQQSDIFSEICSALDYVVSRAHRLTTNTTTNYAERYMSLVSKFSGGKRVNYCQRGSYFRRCVGAGLSYNNGPSWHSSVAITQQHSYLSAFCDRKKSEMSIDRPI